MRSKSLHSIHKPTALTKKQKLTRFCRQNEQYSQMLLKIIEANETSDNNTKLKQSPNSCSEVYRVLCKFNEVLSKQAKAMNAQIKNKAEVTQIIIDYVKNDKKLSNELVNIDQQAVPVFLNFLDQSQKQCEHLTAEIDKLRKMGQFDQYEQELNFKNEQVMRTIKEKQAKSIQLKCKLERLIQQSHKGEAKLLSLRNGIITNEIKLRELEGEQKKLRYQQDQQRQK